jgi:hypothetical protein
MQVEIIIKFEDNTELEQIYTNPSVIMFTEKHLFLVVDGIDGDLKIGDSLGDDRGEKTILSIQYRLEGRKDYKNVELLSLN